MQRFMIVATLLLVLVSLPATAQQPPVDEIDRQASKLEAELGKYRDTSREAAETLVPLVDLYHAHGRVFGLIRAAEKFVAAHPSDSRHAAVMLKLIDGLQATSRNTQLAGTIRQFLARYPDAPQCADLELRLADTLSRMNDFVGAANAYRLVWRRQPDTPAGRQSGTAGVEHFSRAPGNANVIAAAELAEEMLDKAPTADFAKWVGYRALYERRRIGQSAETIVVGNKLLKKGIESDKALTFDVHTWMLEGYERLQQYANAAESARRARQLQDSPELHRRQIERLHAAQAELRQIQPLVAEYLQKYPTRADRYTMQGLLALAYLRAGDRAQCLQLLAEVIKHDAASNGFAATFAAESGRDPQQIGLAEQAIRAAIDANPNDATYLRNVLGFRIYRDFMKDEGKARAVFRELIARSPAAVYTRDVVEWLLDTAPSEDEFRADVARIVASRKENMHQGEYYRFLDDWARKARQRGDADAKTRAKYVTEEVRQADTDPIVAIWVRNYALEAKARSPGHRALLEAATFAKLNDAMARAVAWREAEYLYQYGAPRERTAAIPCLAQVCARFGNDYDLAQRYLQFAVDSGTAEEGKAAAVQMLKLPPQPRGSDVWRRVLTAAEKNADKPLAQQAWNWIAKAHELYGPDPGQASSIGDLLRRLGMEKEAAEYYHRYLAYDRRNIESKYCAQRLYEPLDRAGRIRFAAELAQHDTDYHGSYAQWQADEYLQAGDLNNFENVLRAAWKRQQDRPLRIWDFSDEVAKAWIDKYRTDAGTAEADRLRVYRVVRDVGRPESSALAQLALLEVNAADVSTPIGRLLAYQAATRMVRNDGNGWLRVLPFAQAALGRQDYQAAVTLLTGLLANVPTVAETYKQSARDMVALCYSRMGAVGLTIDESSPLAPLLKAALALRLGDERLAFDSYVANKRLFDQQRTEAPSDLVLFVCEKLIAAGGDENHEYVEETLRGWLVKHGESNRFEATTKAQVQLLLARNYFKAQRYDVARSEFTTVINRYPDTAQALEAEFGIGETFMAQKVYDQAEAVFEKLANRQEREIVVRAEFLRGVLALRRGDHDEAREIFRGVLDRVPDIDLANQALFSLSEVYGAEQRYLDQLRLLRTVGRLGRASKRQHAPGEPLSIVVHDSDLGISRGHHRIPVVVRTEPGGDEETVYLTSAGAGKGLFRVDLDTQLGSAVPGDKVLQLTGRDVIRSDYPAEFKAEFRTVPLSDVEIHVASDAVLDVASSLIVDREEESFSERLAREAAEEEKADQRVSQGRPANQIKPGNPIYLRVLDADRDLSDEPDKAIVKLVAESGDQVQAALPETGPHTGVFEGTVPTGELPAGALATDAAIDHGPLMAIDRDPQTFWQSEPDGATPKSLTIDMKDLRRIDQAAITVPDAAANAPVRAELRGSYDGEFWFHLAGHPALSTAPPVAGQGGRMTRRVYNGRHRNLTTWDDVVALTSNAQPIEEQAADSLYWTRPDEDPNERRAFAVVWRGTLVQPSASAVRIAVTGGITAVAVDGRLELTVGPGKRSVDIFLAAGPHDLTVLATMEPNQKEVEATWARADLSSEQVRLRPFRAEDFNLQGVQGTPPTAPESQVEVTDRTWQFRFPPADVRYVRFLVYEYLGEAVAVSHVEVRNGQDGKVYVPTEADVVGLATNDVLEISGGDVVTATYTDEFTKGNAGSSRLLEGRVTATYFNGDVVPISYNFIRSETGAVQTERKVLLRVDPGERVVLEITDYDEDRTNDRDTVTFQVRVNDGPPLELTAVETEEYTGIFTKEIDTTGEPAEGKLTVKRGDRIVCRYTDAQNTFPGHSVTREAVVLVNEPSQGQVRVLESRLIAPPPGRDAAPRIVYLPQDPAKEIGGVALAAPLTVEVIDPDAAKDSLSSVVVSLATTDGAKTDVRCVVSGAHRPDARGRQLPGETDGEALREGRFLGQVILQLGGASSPEIVPRTIDMPRSLVGGPAVDEQTEETLNADLSVRVLNVAGKDVVTAAYQDALRPDNQPADLTARARLIVNGTLDCTDRDYREPVRQLHVGERMFLKVEDADRDASDERDVVTVEVETKTGDRESVRLEETLIHSGVFTGSLLLRGAERPTAGNLDPSDPAIETYFGDTVHVRLVDEAAATETGQLELTLELPVVIGTDGLVAAFTKTFNDEGLAVETKFHIAESYFELFKSHKQLARTEEQQADLKAGRQILREVMEDYSDPKYAPRVAYLLGQFAQELEQWDEAVASYELIIRRYPDHSLAADAQYKMGQCYEKAGDFDRALEAYVTLAATYPNSPLIASAMIRISDYFFKKERFDVAVQVGEKFLEKFPGNEHSPRMAFRVGMCYYKMEKYPSAGESYDQFVKSFPDDALAADALFWAGESYRLGRNYPEAFHRYNRCRWDFPASEAAKYARGRLTLPEMLRQFELESLEEK